MLNISFKSLKKNKKGMHLLTYGISEIKGNADIRSAVVVCMEDSEIDFDQNMEVIINAGLKIATREYERR